jgi:hypothetical protein
MKWNNVVEIVGDMSLDTSLGPEKKHHFLSASIVSLTKLANARSVIALNFYPQIRAVTLENFNSRCTDFVTVRAATVS